MILFWLTAASKKGLFFYKWVLREEVPYSRGICFVVLSIKSYRSNFCTLHFMLFSIMYSSLPNFFPYYLLLYTVKRLILNYSYLEIHNNCSGWRTANLRCFQVLNCKLKILFCMDKLYFQDGESSPWLLWMSYYLLFSFFPYYCVLM